MYRLLGQYSNNIRVLVNYSISTRSSSRQGYSRSTWVIPHFGRGDNSNASAKKKKKSCAVQNGVYTLASYGSIPESELPARTLGRGNNKQESKKLVLSPWSSYFIPTNLYTQLGVPFP